MITDRPAGKRHGSVSILSAFCMIMIFAFAAFSLDIGYITIVRQELLSAVDAAALAAAQELGDAPDDGLAQVHAAAIQVAQQNLVAGNPLVLDPRTDIEVGDWNPDTNEFTVLDGTDLSLCNSVRINGELAASRDSALNLFFAPVINTRSVDMRESAISIYGSGEPRDVVVVIDCSGSMAQNNRMTYTIPAARALVDELGEDDRLGLAVYSYPAPVENNCNNGGGRGGDGNGRGGNGNGGARGGNGNGRGGNSGGQGGRGGGRSAAAPLPTTLSDIQLPVDSGPHAQFRGRSDRGQGNSRNSNSNRNQNSGRNNAGNGNRNGLLGGGLGGVGNGQGGGRQNNPGNRNGQNRGQQGGGVGNSGGNGNGVRNGQPGNGGPGNNGRGNNGGNNRNGNGGGNRGGGNNGNGNGGSCGEGETRLTGFLERPLNTDFNPVRTRIPQLRPNLYASTTNIAGGLRVAIEELIPKKRTLPNGTEVEQIIVLMTDGHANVTEPPGSTPVNSIYHYVDMAEQNDIIIHGITLGADADESSVRHAADTTGGEYHYVPDGDLVTLFEVYRGIGRGTGSRLVR